MALTMEMLEEKYPLADWTHIYTDGSAEDAVKMEAVACLSGPQIGIPGNERADLLAKSESKQLQSKSTSTYQEAKILLRNSPRCQ